MRSLIIAAALLAGMPAIAANIDTTDSNNLNFFPFGQPNSATYGQTFVPDATDGTLTGFSLYLRGRDSRNTGSGPLNLRGYVAAWDGSKAIGPLLFASPTVTKADSPALQEFAFTTAVPLAVGQAYVAFLSISALPVQPRSLFGTPGPLAGNALDSGQFVFLNNGLDFGAVFTDDWLFIGRDDIFFKATFDPRPVVPGVPEPATWGLMLAGFGMTGIAVRRRKLSAGFTLARTGSAAQ